jgi:GT2 family glycosyltransferase
MNEIAAKLMIGISTRDRWGALLKTLSVVRQLLGGEIKVVVTIDGGTVPIAWREKLEFYRPCIVESVERMGYIYHRNKMAFGSEVPYYLSLDDDSYPALGDLMSAISYLDTNSDVCALAFGIRYLNGEWQIATTANVPYQVAGFVGCAHILRVCVFRNLGGYDKSLVHQGEEAHYTALMLKNGYRCMHFPGPVFVHEFSLVGRSFHRMWYYNSRNKILWAYDFSPHFGYFFVKFIRGTVEQILISIKDKSTARISGLSNALVTIVTSRRKRQPLTADQFKLWHRLFR